MEMQSVMDEIEKGSAADWLAGADLTSLTRRVADGSYVVMHGGFPYHVPDEDGYRERFALLDAYAKKHPFMVKEEHPYEPSAEELAALALAVAKAERAQAVAAITVEVDGMIFDGDEPAQERMARAVLMAESPDEITEWVLHDHTVAEVSADQLRRACRAAGKAQTALWTLPYEG